MTFEEWVAAIRAKTAALNQLADELDALAFDIPPVIEPPEPVIEEVTGAGGGKTTGKGAAQYVPAPAFPGGDKALAETFQWQADAPPTIRASGATFMTSMGGIALAESNVGRINFA